MASDIAVARPIPLPAPVTIATLPLSFNVVSLPRDEFAPARCRSKINLAFFVRIPIAFNVIDGRK
jgi:hypothetical protein